jgi:simple sugar transport system permease protein
VSATAEKEAPRSLARAALPQVLPPVASVAFALALGAILLAAIHKDVLAIYKALLLDTLGTGDDVGAVIYRTSVYALSGLAVAWAFRAGLFNIGGEGQMLVGGFVMAIVAAWVSAWPRAAALPVALGAGAAFGALWALLPALLRTRLGVHEVLTTIMMNLVASPLVLFFLELHRAAHEAEVGQLTRTVKIGEPACLPSLGWLSDALEGTQASAGAFLALAACLAAAWAIARTRTGYELRAVGHNADAARAAGIAVEGTWLRALLVSGALAGLAAAPAVLGYKHWYEDGMLAGYGFTGIAVAVLGGNRPLRVLAAAFGLAFLAHGGEVVNGTAPDQVRKEIVQVLTAIIILAVLVAQNVAGAAVARAEARRARRDG